MHDELDRKTVETLFPGWSIEIHEQLPSTNQYMMQKAATIKTPATVVALQQTQGRGRGGNSWWSDRSSLTFSVMFPPEEFGFARSRQQLLSLITAALVRESILSAENFEASRFQLKWPNDLYLDDKKVCGILLEQPGIPDDVIVIGIGLNVNNSFQFASEEVRQKAISLYDAFGEKLQLTKILVSIMAGFQQLFENESFRQNLFPAAWEKCHVLDQKLVTIDQAGKKMTGRCEGIDENGALILRDMFGLHQIHSAVILDWE